MTSNQDKINNTKAVLKGINVNVIADKNMKKQANELLLMSQMQADWPIAKRVEKEKHNHPTIEFVGKHLDVMAAILCCVGHITDNLAHENIDSCFLHIPEVDLFEKVAEEISRKLEGSHLHCDRKNDGLGVAKQLEHLWDSKHEMTSISRMQWPEH